MTAPLVSGRIILGATTLADAAGTLALATALASALAAGRAGRAAGGDTDDTGGGAEIHGLLVEDDEVLALATAHAASIVAPAGRAAVMLDPAALHRAFAREAAGFQRLLAEAAARAALRASFSRGRGRLAAALAAAAAPGDLLVVPAGPFRTAVREVVVLSAGLSDPVLPAMARATAERLRRPLRTIPAPGGPAADAAGPAASPAPQAGLLAALAGLGPGSLLFAELPRSGLSLEDVLRRTRCIHVLRA